MDVKSIVMVLLIAVVSMAFVGSAAAATYYVNPGDSIQATINGAADGDTIVIYGGDYVENVVVNKSVAIVSMGALVDIEASGWEIGGEFWWIFPYPTYYYTWAIDIDYDEQVTVTAADDRQSVFTVESDNVLICNIDVDIDSVGSYYYYDYDYPDWWYAGYVEWAVHIHDYPMAISGAYKSDEAGVEVNGATGTVLFNLIASGNDNGVKLIDAVDTTIVQVEMNGNNKEGLVAYGCDGVYVYDCVVVDSGKRGIEIEDSANVEMDNVLVLNSGKDNIELVNVDGVFMYEVVADGTNKNGMSLDGCTDVNIEYSAALNSGRSGLYMNACDGTMVDYFEAADNDNYGLKIMYTDNIDFTNIGAHDNGEDFKHHDCTGCTGLP